MPVAERRKKAAREIARLKKAGQNVAPVVVEGRKIAASFWGKAWCDNLESYQDYANRVERGRSYVRNGAVIDLRIGPREVRAKVIGSEIYAILITIKPLPAAAWTSICADCAGRVDSLVELLQGTLLESGHGARLPAGRRPVSETGRHQVLLQLSGWRLDVQACRGGALRRWRAFGR